MIHQMVTTSVTQSVRISILLFFSISSLAQTPLSFSDFSAFKDPGRNWQLAGKVTADLMQDNTLKTEKGQGILVNIPNKKENTDLYTKEEFSDADIEFDYLMPKNGNAGIYIQGRYEVQLRDSWGVLTPSSSNNGGIYARWDEKRGKGNEGYDGQPPRVNVSRAPGLWQHMKISFQAPKFDAAGNKTQNAKILSIQLNGVLIHENAELRGATRGADGNNEVASGPLRLQGDHGGIAFRNLTIRKYNGQPPVFKDIHYSVYYSKHEKIPDFSKMKPDDQGTLRNLSISFLKKDYEFLIRYTGNVQISQAGEYTFQRETAGRGFVKINNQVVSDITSYTTTPIQLAAGNYPFEIIYMKSVNWYPTSFGLTVLSPGIRDILISDETSLYREYPDQIMVDAQNNTVHRSFIDLPDGKRIVHAASAGSMQQLHYTFDMDNGMLAQIWRGGFLDATPMWNSRGDGSSKPTGSTLQLGESKPSIIKLNSADSSAFRTKGYELDNTNRPTFMYNIYGAGVRDYLQVSDNGQELKRTVTVTNNPGNLHMRIAEGKSIENISKGLYIIDDKACYIRLDDASLTPLIRQSEGGRTELLVPLQNTLSYSILF